MTAPGPRGAGARLPGPGTSARAQDLVDRRGHLPLAGGDGEEAAQRTTPSQAGDDSGDDDSGDEDAGPFR